jgi:hypothetical protein
MLTKLIVLMGLCLLATTPVHAAGKTLKKGTLVCSSSDGYDTQMKYVVNNINKYAPGCGGLKQSYEVVIIDFNMLSASEVQVVETGANIWVASEDIK